MPDNAPLEEPTMKFTVNTTVRPDPINDIDIDKDWITVTYRMEDGHRLTDKYYSPKYIERKLKEQGIKLKGV